MKRVCVIGCSGSGKTTLGSEIAERTGLPQISLDSIYWKSGWVQTSREEWRPIHAKLIAQDRWVMDGNFFHTLDARLAAADTVVFIDLPTLPCFYRVVKRTAQWWGRTRPDMGPDCNERLDLNFLRYVWNFNREHRPLLVAGLERHPSLVVHTIRNNAERQAFLDSL
jgi:adenylate kinase family enzyme